MFTHGASAPIGANGRGMDMKDMDGDGDLDIVVANRGSNTVTVLENNGDATFISTTPVNSGRSQDGRRKANSCNINAICHLRRTIGPKKPVRHVVFPISNRPVYRDEFDTRKFTDAG